MSSTLICYSISETYCALHTLFQFVLQYILIFVRHAGQFVVNLVHNIEAYFALQALLAQFFLQMTPVSWLVQATQFKSWRFNVIKRLCNATHLLCIAGSTSALLFQPILTSIPWLVHAGRADVTVRPLKTFALTATILSRLFGKRF